MNYFLEVHLIEIISTCAVGTRLTRGILRGIVYFGVVCRYLFCCRSNNRFHYKFDYVPQWILHESAEMVVVMWNIHSVYTTDKVCWPPIMGVQRHRFRVRSVCKSETSSQQEKKNIGKRVERWVHIHVWTFIHFVVSFRMNRLNVVGFICMRRNKRFVQRVSRCVTNFC